MHDMEAVGEGLSLTIMWALAGEYIHSRNHFSTKCSEIMRTKERDLVVEEDNITEEDLLGLQLSLLSTKCVFIFSIFIQIRHVSFQSDQFVPQMFSSVWYI